jgi:hypothetical protein
MNRLTQLREQIDACRPGSDDLALPALAELAQAVASDRAVPGNHTVADEFDRAQRFDRAVVSALHEVPVPGDLLGRLLAQAEQNQSLVGNASVGNASVTSKVLAAGSDGATDEAAPMPASGVSPQVARRSRRWLAGAAAVASLAAALAIGLGVFLPRPPRDVSQTQLAEAAADWYAESGETADWQPYSGPLPHTALLLPPTRSCSISTEFGRATAYEVSSSRGRAVLIVVSTRDRFAVAPLPFSALPGASRGLAIGAWQSGGKLFLVVLNKDGLRLDDVLRKSRAA